MRRSPLVRATTTLLAAAAVAVALGCGETTVDPLARPPVPLDLQLVASGLALPVQLTAPAGDARLFIVEKTGHIRVMRAGAVLPTPFLDLSARVSTAGEDGLLSMAFDPAFALNGHVFVYFVDRDGDIAIERFTATAGADVADPASATRVITIPHPTHANHNGGLVQFGPDGMLYLATGDGGGAGDPAGNAQNLNSLLGKMLRLDVRTLPYTIPASNPFVGQAGRRGEIWAYGLRNPWRFDFHGYVQLYIADVGQGLEEEINAVPADTAGVNYGWNVTEGTRCFRPSSNCDRTGRVAPVYAYGRDRGCSIIGGFLYEGRIEALRGEYLFSDYCTGFLGSLSEQAAGLWIARYHPVTLVGDVVGLGRDGRGEPYLLTGEGRIYRVVERER